MAVLSLVDFGAFTTTFLITLTAVGYVKAMTSEPLTLRFAASPRHEQREAVSAGLGASLVLGVAVMPLVFVITWGILLLAGLGLEQAAVLGALTALGLPASAVQEYLRGAAYCTGELHAAALNSIGRLLLLPALVLAGWLLDVLDVQFFVVAWWAAAAGAALIGWVALSLPRVHLRTAWVREHGALGLKLMADYSLTLTSGQGALLVVSSIGGAETVGLIRKAQTVMAPLTLMTTGSISLFQPALVRRVAAGESAGQLRTRAYVISIVIILVGAAWATLAYLVPADVAGVVLGEGWSQARALLPWVLLYTSLGALTGMLGIALRALGVVQEQVKVRGVLAIPTLLMIAILATRGAVAATIGLCIGVAVVVVAWDLLLRRPRRRRNDVV